MAKSSPLAKYLPGCNNVAIMPRFVLLRHQCPPASKKPKYEKPSHWDFMLESGGVLRTWELQELPPTWADLLGVASGNNSGNPSGNDIVQATALPDHRLAYIDFEGPLSGDRGSVCRCDHGTYEPMQETHEQLLVQLEGELLRGTVRLTRRRQGWELSLGEP